RYAEESFGRGGGAMAQFLWGDALAASTGADAAVGHWRAAGDGTSFRLRGEGAASKGGLGQAGALLNVSTRIDPSDAAALSALASALAKQGELARARDGYLRARALGNAPKDLVGAGVQELGLGRADQALDLFLRACALEPGNGWFAVH